MAPASSPPSYVVYIAQCACPWKSTRQAKSLDKLIAWGSMIHSQALKHLRPLISLVSCHTN